MIIKVFQIFNFLIFYLSEVIKTNFILAYEVLTPTHYMKPGFIKIDVSELTERELLVFCNLLTMTPGSMVVNVSQCKNFIYIHILYLDNRKQVEHDIRQNYLKKVKEML